MSPERRLSPMELGLGVTLYALQGVVVAYLLNYNKSYMIAGGVEERLAGRIETAVLLTLVFKFLLGPLSDRVSPLGWGHRRPYIMMGLIGQSLGLIGLASFHPGTSTSAFGLMAFLAVGGLALYDTCCDGFMVDVTPPQDRVRVQGFLQVARFAATMGCTWMFGRWMATTGIGPDRSEGVIWICAAMGGIPFLFACLVRERARTDSADAFQWSALKAIGRPDALVLLAFGALYGMIGVGIEFNLSRYYVSLGFDQGDVGSFGALRYAGRAAGALALPLLKARLGRRGELSVGVLALAGTIAGQSIAGDAWVTGAWAFLFGMANGWNDALFCVLAMEASDPRMAASTFAVFMAISNVGVIGNSIVLEAAHAMGEAFRPVFLITAILTLGLFGFTRRLARLGSKDGVDHGAL